MSDKRIWVDDFQMTLGPDEFMEVTGICLRYDPKTKKMSMGLNEEMLQRNEKVYVMKPKTADIQRMIEHLAWLGLLDEFNHAVYLASKLSSLTDNRIALLEKDFERYTW